MQNKYKQSSSIVKDYAYCEDIIKKHSKSFYFAFSKLPNDKANAVYAIYAFCRLADDSIDEAETKEEQAESLAFMSNELSRFEQKREPDHPVWRALRDVFNRYEMSIQPFYDQLDGQEMDYHFEQPQTMEDLEEYSYYVAGSVGLMLLPVIASDNHKDLEEEAIALGVAMQLTNILRDVGEDYQKNKRIYLPKELMDQENYSSEDVVNQVIDDGFITIWEKIAERAERLYEKFSESLKYFDKDSQLQVALSAKVYGGILDAVRENNYDCYTMKNKTSPSKKIVYYNEIRKIVSEIN